MRRADHSVSLPFRLVGLLLLLILSSARAAFPAPQTANSADIPVVKGGAGSCSADFVVTGASGKALYDAKISILIKYGFMGLHKLDLTVGTNFEGKARVEGLPERIKPPAEFKVTQGGQTKTLPFDPDADCHAKYQVTLEEPAGRN